MKSKFRGIVSSLVVLCALILPMASMAYTVGGVELVQRGIGSRSLLGMDLYQASLSVPAGLLKAPAKEVITADQSMSVTLFVRSNIPSGLFNKQIQKGFVATNSVGYHTDKSEYYRSLLQGIDVAKGGKWIHDYDAKTKLLTVTYVYPDGRKRVLGTVPGAQFKAALFAMWIGPKPTSEGLRAGMLGEK